MSGLSIGRSHPRPCSGAKTLRKCWNNNVEADNVIIIDVESFDNVIIIDVPESLPKKAQHLSTDHRKDKKPLFKKAICIDDDESNDISDSFGFSAGTSPNKDGENSPPCEETCIINEREKLKETDEYKRAMEEEWASRQQALQIQAEEARNLRRLQKRRKAESLRLLDMERRQKERIEEVRNSQMKDEENMNLKERFRTELRSELKKLEVSCHSMASLLHLLGISVGSWPNPSVQEVQTAYKRALLTFHPDRASHSDVRQQVEAEEKFKLVNRLKEKYTT